MIKNVEVTLGLPTPPLSHHGAEDQIDYDEGYLPSDGPWKVIGRKKSVWINSQSAVVMKRSFPHEADMIEAVRANTNIPVPEVLHQWRDADNQHYIAMRRAPGFPLADVWPNLSNAQQDFIKFQLNGYLLQLRAVPRSKVTEPPMMTDRFFWPRARYSTPPTAAHFVSNLIMTLGETTGWDGCSILRHVCDSLEKLPTASDLVFTHGDLDPRHILIDEHCRVTCILDWTQAGFCPAWWEWVKAHLWEHDSEFVRDHGWEGVLKSYPVEWAVMYMAKEMIF